MPRSHPPQVLALVASTGLGGGIETFVDAAFDPMDGLRVDRTTVALTDASHRRSNLLRKLGMLDGVVSRCLRSNSGELQIVVFHPSLTVIGVVGQWLARSSRPPIIGFYGVDIWRTARWQLRLAKRSSGPHSQRLQRRCSRRPRWILRRGPGCGEFRQAALAGCR